MKKIKLLLMILVLFMFPVSALAKEKINIYMFKGNGCPRCAEATTFFESIEDEYGQYFNLKTYEVWYNEDNAKLMDKVGEKLGEDPQGVPYIIIGKKTFEGYADTMNEELKQTIKDAYDSDDYYDVIYELTGKTSNSMSNPLVGITFVCIIGGLVAFFVINKKRS